jgi:hypothetical protein
MRELCLGGLLVAVAGCVPNGPSSSSTDAGAAAQHATAARPKAAPAPATSRPGTTNAAASPPLGAGFEDKFDRAAVGPDWIVTGGGWRIEDGRLCVKGARNHGVWLNRSLPTNARIEFDAMSRSPDGDLKAEIFGDGTSAATSISYNDATSYLTIFGGWKNSFHVLARLNEHASDRPEIRITPGSDDERARPVNAEQTYRFRVERADGKTISWWVDNVLMFKFTDPQPLTGPGHDHLGFNDWDVPVCFDNVKIVAL